MENSAAARLLLVSRCAGDIAASADVCSPCSVWLNVSVEIKVDHPEVEEN